MSKELIELSSNIINRIDYREGDEEADYFFSALMRKNPDDYIAYAAVVEGKIIGMGAVYRLFNNVAEGLMTFAEGWMQSEYDPSTRFVYKKCKEVINQAKERFDLNRIQVYVDPAYPEYMNFIQHLGFEREGLLRKFWDGKDYFIYARIF